MPRWTGIDKSPPNCIGLLHVPSGSAGPTDLPTHSSPLQYQYGSASAADAAIIVAAAIIMIFIAIRYYKSNYYSSQINTHKANQS
jgi:hypothetical protein